MTFTQLRTQVDALCRKYASELEIYRARPLVLEFCDEMAESVSGSKPGPARPLLKWAQLLLGRMADRGFRDRNHGPLQRYLESCLDKRVLPQVNDVLRSLMPKAAQRGLIPRSIQPVSF